MELDNHYKNKIDSLLEGYKLNELKEVVSSISSSYLEEHKSSVINNELKAKIYAAFRMPATYKAVSEVLIETFSRYNPDIKSSLDLGAGLGAASLALSHLKEDISYHLYEKESAMRQLGKEILEDDKFIYQEFDLTKDNIKDKYDIVMSTYVLNEIDKSSREEVINKMYNASNDIIVVVEPGTPSGYQIIKEVRDNLLTRGMHIIAPCPHEDKCPMKDNDWCHFSTRVQRSKLHKDIKGGEAPFEDEKYSYIVFSKSDVSRCSSRILRRPIINKGMIKLTTCSKDGISNVEIRKNHPNYKVIKKLKVGDSF